MLRKKINGVLKVTDGLEGEEFRIELSPKNRNIGINLVDYEVVLFRMTLEMSEWLVNLVYFMILLHQRPNLILHFSTTLILMINSTHYQLELQNWLKTYS